MTARLLLALAAVMQLLLLLTPAADAAYYSLSRYSYYGYSYSYSYYRYSYSYGYVYTYSSGCSIGCIAGAVVGGLVLVGGVIGLLVFLCCFCKAAKTRRVVPNQTVTVSSGRVLNATNSSYPMQPPPQQPQPPPYDQSQMYPPVGAANHPAYPPAYPPQAAQPSNAPGHLKPDDTAYPPPAYSSAGGTQQ